VACAVLDDAYRLAEGWQLPFGVTVDTVRSPIELATNAAA
jgi:hypothetical protein